MAPPRSDFVAPPQGGDASGPAEPDPRRPLDGSALVVGLGATGLAMARECTRRGLRVQVWDSRESPPQAATLARDCPRAELLRELPPSLDGIGRVLKSPGLSPHDARIAPLLADARARGIAVQGELDLFVQALPAGAVVVAVTGTNGKTTTTALTALLIGATGRRVAVAGNIGPTMLDTLAAVEQAPDVWVLELSSFQLDGVQGFEPAAAALLNLSQDHLDWHGSMAAYGAAKARIAGARTTVVVNRDDPALAALLLPQAAPTKGRGTKAAVERSVLRFGTDAPARPGDWGLVVDGGIAWLVRALPAEAGRRAKAGADDEDLHLQRLMPADDLQIRGRHNAANALAALALGTAIGCPLAPMLHALRHYTGEPHRVQHVATIGGVEAYDDSKGTNVGATVAALAGLGAEKAPGKLVVILGGDGKGQDFAPLASPLTRYARAVATIGRDAAEIEAVLGGSALPVQRHATLPAAVAWCFDQAEAGDAVLLSPACASLDMFRDYAHRADVFVASLPVRTEQP